MRTSVQLAPALAACAASEAERRSHAGRAGMARGGHCLGEGAIVASVPIDLSGCAAWLMHFGGTTPSRERDEATRERPSAASCDSLAASARPAQVPAR